MLNDRSFPRKGYAHTVYVERNLSFNSEPVAYWDPPKDNRTNGDCYIKFTMTFDYLDRSKENRVSVYAVVQNKAVVRVSQEMPVNLPTNSSLYTISMVTSINRNRRLDDDRCISTAQRYPHLAPDVVRKITRCEKFIAASQRKIAQYKSELEREEKRLEGNFTYLKSLSQQHNLSQQPTEDTNANYDDNEYEVEECCEEEVEVEDRTLSN